MEYGTVNRDKLTATTDFSKTVEFRPKAGTSQVRVLPPHKNSDTWFHRSLEHWVDGVGYVPCLRQFGKPCPICEEGEKLYQSGNEELVKTSIDLRPREQYYFNVVVFNDGTGNFDPKSGVKIMRTGVKIFKPLRTFDNDEASGWGDMTNLETGFNVSIQRTGQGRKDTEYTVSPVNSKGETLKAMLTRHSVDLETLELHNLNEYVQSLTLSYEEMKSKFENKQVAPGFPGGPRLSPLQTPPPPVMTETPRLTTIGDVVAPPTIEED